MGCGSQRRKSKNHPTTDYGEGVSQTKARALAALLSTAVLALGLGLGSVASADETPKCEDRAPNQFPLQFNSVEKLADGRYQFRLCAPHVAEARFLSGDLPGIPFGMGGAPPGLAMTKDALGYWSATTATPVDPGVYRYAFNVEGVTVVDPQAVKFSQGWRGVQAVFEVPGPSAKFYSYDAAVPHGVVSTVNYPSTTLGDLRRAHVYTPPGYEAGGNRRYPVLYLVHGAGDSDNSWTSVGHANLILDNLIASGKAEPMIVVMPFGHTPIKAGMDQFNNTDFGGDLLKDLIPYVDGHFRTQPKPDRRAMAGLSMGGAHTLAFGLPHPELFGQIGVFSMGFFMPGQDKTYTDLHDAELKHRATSTKPIFFAMGKDDFLHGAVGPTRKMLDDYKIRYVYRESAGGHTWSNWRDYLAEFAPTLFR